MNFDSNSLERYSFIWLMLMLVLSAAAMFLGAKPLAMVVFGYSSSAVYSLLDLSWIVSGLVAVYITHAWLKNGKKVFDGDDTKTNVAFWFMLLAGYNLGLTGLLGNNIFLSIFMSQMLWYVAGLACLVAAYLLFTAWKANGEQLFSVCSIADNEEAGSTENSDSRVNESVPTQVEEAAASVEADSHSTETSDENEEVAVGESHGDSEARM